MRRHSVSTCASILAGNLTSKLSWSWAGIVCEVLIHLIFFQGRGIPLGEIEGQYWAKEMISRYQRFWCVANSYNNIIPSSSFDIHLGYFGLMCFCNLYISMRLYHFKRLISVDFKKSMEMWLLTRSHSCNWYWKCVVLPRRIALKKECQRVGIWTQESTYYYCCL